MSMHHCALAFEEAIEQEVNLADIFQLRHLTIGCISTDKQPACQVVKVSGNITVSF